MKKPNIKKLKYPIWFNIVFYCLTVVIPLIFIAVQGFNSPSKVFKISFTVICASLLLWVFIRKFILHKYEDKLNARKVSLEHDYEINVGDSRKAKWLWFSNEITLTIINVIQVVLVGGLILLMAIGIESCAIKVKGLSLLITILYFLAYFIKFALIIVLREAEANGDLYNE